MPDVTLHHVSIVVTDLGRSIDFYQTLFELKRLPRPPFDSPGAWLGSGEWQLHLLENEAGTFRTNDEIDIADCHFAFRTDDFEGVLARLKAQGFSEGAVRGDPKRVLLLRHGKAGFPQLYILDPDRNVVEVNGSPVRWP